MARFTGMMIDGEGDYDSLVAVAVQAAVASPAVVNAPANVAPSAPAVEEVVTAVIKAVAPDDSDDRLRQIARQATQAVVTSPAIIATPAGQTVAPAVVQTITTTALQGLKNDSAATVTLAAGTGATGATGAQGAVTGATGATGAKGTTGGATGATGAVDTKPDPTKTAYADLTPAQRDAMSQQEKMDYIEAARVASMAADASARAATDPMKNFAVRPAAPAAAPGMINYYSWIGGVGTGEWKLYQAPDTPENQAKYGSRSFGGATQATTESAVGANTLVNQPVYNPNTGKYTASSGATGATGFTGGTTGPTGGTTGATGATGTTGATGFTGGATGATGYTGTDPATLALIKSLESQIASLTKAQTDAANKADTTAAATAAQIATDKATARKNAIDVLTERFQRYGLGSLVNKIKELAVDGATEATITLGLQETEEYKQRFKANQDRVKKGLQVLNPAEYLNLEDGYRQVLRAYGLKQFDTDAYVSQFISNDVSAAELSNRVVTAVQRVQNADPAISSQLRDYYGIGQADLVAYVLDPEQQFQKIERQVAAAEIGVAAGRQGLKPGVSVAEQLAAQGVSQAEAQKGYATIADILPTAEKLSDIYGKTMDTYGQSEAEQEVFNSLASAQRKRQKLTAREVAAFSGTSGTNRTSLTTSKIGQF